MAPLPTAAIPVNLPGKPNIVVFLLDDTNPMDGRLWNDPTLTPNIYDLFVAHGLHFPNAVGETPLCCPSRATLLTGQHTQNHGVLVNDGTLFNPAETIAKEMQGVGYHTMLAGKYFNKVYQFTANDWTKHIDGWDDMDVFVNNPGDEEERWYYNYDVRQRDGILTHYDTEHSTRFVTEDTVARMQATPADQPLFSMLSIFNTHVPNVPMPEYAGDPRCDSMPAWNPPNYNEADISDKPSYVRQHAAYQPLGGYPTVQFCREMLGVDWMVGQVTQELTNEGRFDNTLFVFLGDNGMTWGEHRLPESKNTSYATPIPLYMSWKDGWGADPRTIDEYVSDIDFAPTLCDFAGCTMGPFPNGVENPDGLSLKPVIDAAVAGGDPVHMGRDAILQSNFEVPWWGLRTTPESSLGLWAYTEWANGELELYEMSGDPWQMQNVAYDPGYASIRSSLRQRLAALKLEGRPPGLVSKVTVVQNSQPTGAQDFSFSGDFGSFSLDSDSNATLPRKKTFTNLETGTYSLTQAKAAGWTLQSIVCPGADIDLTTGTAVLYVQAGDSITCTFTDLRRRPDTSIALADVGPYKGVNVFSSTPVKKQTQKRDAVEPGVEYDYYVTLQNASKKPDSFTAHATITSAASMSASFWAAGVDVTAAVLDGTYQTASLKPGATSILTVRVFVAAEAVVGDKNTVVVTASSSTDPSAVDVVRAITIR